MDYLKKKEKISSELLYIVSFLYALNASALVLVYFVFEMSASSNDIYVSFLREFPTFGLVPLISVFTSLIFLYLAIKIRSLSKNVFHASLISTVILPIVTLILSKVFMAPFINISGTYTDTGILGVNLATSKMPVFFDLILLLSTLAFLALLFARKRFTQPSSQLSSKAKKWLLVFVIFIVFPVIGLSTFSYMRSFENNFGYTKIQSENSFHIYRPDLSNTDWENRSFYKKINAPATNNTDGVQSAYSKPFFKSFNDSKSGPNLILIQSRITPPFNINSFMGEFISNGNLKTEPVTTSGYKVKIAKDLMIQHLKSDETNVYWVAITTNDDVLIVIAGISTDLDELLRFANSLY